MRDLLKLLIAIVISELTGVIGSFFTVSEINGWYSTLQKPLLNPPTWVFGPVWITLFALMGVAAFLVWRKGLNRRDVRIALLVFAFQLLANMVWSIIFFGMHNPRWAFFDIILLWVAIVGTIAVFSKVSKSAAWLLVPYILWVSFAGYLNYSVWQLNNNQTLNISLPQGYTLDSYTVAKVSEISCVENSDCETPGEYLVQSRCPFTSMCLKNKCAVVCPSYADNK